MHNKLFLKRYEQKNVQKPLAVTVFKTQHGHQLRYHTHTLHEHRSCEKPLDGCVLVRSEGYCPSSAWHSSLVDMNTRYVSRKSSRSISERKHTQTDEGCSHQQILTHAADLHFTLLEGMFNETHERRDN